MTCRHYTDVVLIAVVALCTLENDVIHAGYLALALLFFRRRDELRVQRNRCNVVSNCLQSVQRHAPCTCQWTCTQQLLSRLVFVTHCRMFKWLPVYNFLVMFVTLAYQAPFERLFGHFIHPDEKVSAGPSWPVTPPDCSAAAPTSPAFTQPCRQCCGASLACVFCWHCSCGQVVVSVTIDCWMLVQSRLCNLPHLAELYKMVGATGRLVGLSARGAVADMLLWAIARVQTRVFASDSYRKCVP